MMKSLENVKIVFLWPIFFVQKLGKTNEPISSKVGN